MQMIMLEDKWSQINMIFIFVFIIWPILEARAEIQNYFCSFIGSNEDIQKSFWNYLTFKEKLRSYCLIYVLWKEVKKVLIELESRLLPPTPSPFLSTVEVAANIPLSRSKLVESLFPGLVPPFWPEHHHSRRFK